MDHQFHDDFQLGISVFRFLIPVLASSSDASSNANVSLSLLLTLTYMLFCRLDKFRVCMGPRVQSLFSRLSQARLMMLDVLLGLPFQVRVGIGKDIFTWWENSKTLTTSIPYCSLSHIFSRRHPANLLKSKSVQLFCILPVLPIIIQPVFFCARLTTLSFLVSHLEHKVRQRGDANWFAVCLCHLIFPRFS